MTCKEKDCAMTLTVWFNAERLRGLEIDCASAKFGDLKIKVSCQKCLFPFRVSHGLLGEVGGQLGCSWKAVGNSLGPGLLPNDEKLGLVVARSGSPWLLWSPCNSLFRH